MIKVCRAEVHSVQSFCLARLAASVAGTDNSASCSVAQAAAVVPGLQMSAAGLGPCNAQASAVKSAVHSREGSLSTAQATDRCCACCRCLGVAWGNEELALVYETWYKTRRSVIHTINPSRPEDGMQVLSDR